MANNRRAFLKSLVNGVLQSAGTVVLASTVLQSGQAMESNSQSSNDDSLSLTERADLLAAECGDISLEPSAAPNAWINGGFRNNAFRNAGFRNGGFNNAAFRNGGGGFRNNAFRNGGIGGGGGFRNNAFRNF